MTLKLSCELKGTLATVNIFFVVSGVISLFVGISAFLAVQRYEEFLGPGNFNEGIVFVATGAFILLVAIVGLYAIIRENYLLIIAYVVAMGIVLIMHLGASISSFSIREGKLGELQDIPHSLMWYYGKSRRISQQWDRLQQELKCCGAHNPSEWLLFLSTEQTLKVPLSCCSIIELDCTVKNAHPRGCSDPLVHFMASFFDAIGFGGLFLAFIQALMIVNVVSALWIVKVARQA